MRYFYDGSSYDDDEDDSRASARRGERREPLGDEAPDEEADESPLDSASLDDADDDSLEDDESLDEDFPGGDGTADTETVVFCPYCGELNEVAVDPGGGPAQSYVEDCQVCCRPWRVSLAFGADGRAVAQVEAADDL